MEEAVEHAVGDERDAPARQPLAVVAVGTERPLVGGIVDEGQQRRGDGVAHPVGEGRAALEHHLAVEHAADDAEQGGADVGARARG